MGHNLKSKSSRAKLQPRREPYWHRIEAGLHIGYRALDQGSGTWISRKRDHDGKQKYHSLGSLDDFDDAVKAVSAWATSVDQGVVSFNTTVGDACKNYVEHIRLKKSAATAKDAEGRFKRLIYGQRIASIPLAKLTAGQTRKWLNDQVADDEDDEEEDIRRSKDSANRNLSSFKAALNHALRDRLVATDAGWKTVTPFAKVGKRREHFLTEEERRVLLDNAPEDLRGLLTALLLTAARPGELAKANISDFDKNEGTLTLNGKTGPRTVTVSTQAIKFFTTITKHRIGQQPLLVRDDGARWNKDWWKKLMKTTVAAAGLSSDIVMYHLRHAAISEMIAQAMDSSLVAKLAGTSTAMIDRHYGHLRHDKTRAMLDAVQMNI